MRFDSNNTGVILKCVAAAFSTASLLVFISCSEESPTGPIVRVPTVTTAAVTAITPTSAGCGGSVTSDGGKPVTARGITWSTTPAPTVSGNKTIDGTGTGSFTSGMTGLTGGTTYYVRAYATNSAGTGYGNTVSFETILTLTDIDGHTYETIKIGDQWWMAENLKVTHYRNGDAIPNITNNASWVGLITGAYGNYNNDPAAGDVYGRLYNWFAVADTNGLAPAGWHVASDTEWQTLVDYLGGDGIAGGKMKEAGTSHWIDPNDATNESGFSALPAGMRYTGNGNYFNIGDGAFFWSSTELDSILAWNRSLFNDDAAIYRDSNNGKQNGFSVRCVKD